MLTKLNAQKALRQILDSVELPKQTKKDEKVFLQRIEQHFPALLVKLYELYGDHYDFFFHAQKLVVLLATSFCEPQAQMEEP